MHLGLFGLFMDGLIRFLLKKDKVSEALRKRIIFKVIPMINADGVSIGKIFLNYFPVHWQHQMLIHRKRF